MTSNQPSTPPTPTDAYLLALERALPGRATVDVFDAAVSELGADVSKPGDDPAVHDEAIQIHRDAWLEGADARKLGKILRRALLRETFSLFRRDRSERRVPKEPSWLSEPSDIERVESDSDDPEPLSFLSNPQGNTWFEKVVAAGARSNRVGDGTIALRAWLRPTAVPTEVEAMVGEDTVGAAQVPEAEWAILRRAATRNRFVAGHLDIDDRYEPPSITLSYYRSAVAGMDA